mmetsp:Transcript_25256/g.35270  ORF Transcript_25256/g.35270 Transcript_25256/m.35270 type:complete len:178 (-) Transcript_25256:257-790(-)
MAGLQVAVATTSLLCLWRRRNHLLEGRQDPDFVRHSYMKRILASTLAAAILSAAGWITWLSSCDRVLRDNFSTAPGFAFYMSVAASIFCALAFVNECGIVSDIIHAAEEGRQESSTVQNNPPSRLRSVVSVRSSVPPKNSYKKSSAKNYSSNTMKNDDYHDGEASRPPANANDASRY